MLPKKIIYYTFLIPFSIIITGIFLYVNYYVANRFLSSINYWFLLNEMFYKVALEFFEYIYYNFPKIYLYSTMFVTIIPIYCSYQFWKNKQSIVEIFLMMFLTFFTAFGLIFPFDLYDYSSSLIGLEYYYFVLFAITIVINLLMGFRLAKNIIDRMIKLLKFLWGKLGCQN